MEHKYTLNERYTELAHQVIHSVPELNYLASAQVTIGYMESDYKKKSHGRVVFAECIKVKDIYKYFTPCDFLIVVYEPNVALMDEVQLKILLEHELLHIKIENPDDIEPVYSINPHDVEDFRSILDKYGIDWNAVDDI